MEFNKTLPSLSHYLLYLSILVLGLETVYVGGQYGQFTNQLGGQELVLLQMPSTRLSYNQKNFYPMARALVRFAKSIMGKDNIIVMADRQVIKYLKGYLPYDILLESQVSDLWLRDLAPVRDTFFKFKRHDGTTVQQNNFRLMLQQCTHSGKTLRHSRLVADGGNIVHNDEDTAILTSNVLSNNLHYTDTEVKGQLRSDLHLNNIVILPLVSGETTGHADLSVSFLDRRTVAYSDLNKQGLLRHYLETHLGREYKLVELDSVVLRDSVHFFNTACGLHVNILSTDRYLYVPMFGLDPDNKKRGQSLKRDMDVLTKIARNTDKIVVPIPIPFFICQLGGNARCLTWQTRGSMADDLIMAARNNQCFSHFGRFIKK